jgi:CheY-like chemotaxis protein
VKALIVDDEHFNILGLGMILKTLEITYESAYSGKDCLEKI